MTNTRATEVARLSGIVLAGGRSTRFGRDKLVEPVGGEPLLWRPIRVLASVCDEVIVAVASGRRYPLPVDAAAPVRHVEDERAGAGPVEGLRVALAAAGHPIALVVGGDMPTMSVEDLRRLAAAVGRGAAAASFGQPLPCVLAVAPARAALSDGRPRALRHVLGALAGVELSPTAVATLRDVDEPADLPLA